MMGRKDDYCPLSMIGGSPTACVHSCVDCPLSIGRDLVHALRDVSDTLNYPEAMFGTSGIESGLHAIADAVLGE